jgi:hypothetical protein
MNRINIETSEGKKVPSPPIGWNPAWRQWNMNTDNSKTRVFEPSPSKVEKRNSSKDQRVLEIPDGVRSEERIGDDNQLVINSGEAKQWRDTCTEQNR